MNILTLIAAIWLAVGCLFWIGYAALSAASDSMRWLKRR